MQNLLGVPKGFLIRILQVLTIVLLLIPIYGFFSALDYNLPRLPSFLVTPFGGLGVYLFYPGMAIVCTLIDWGLRFLNPDRTLRQPDVLDAVAFKGFALVVVLTGLAFLLLFLI